MKKHFSNLGNLFAVAILFFAFYLNYMHKNNVTISSQVSTVETGQKTFEKTTLVENPETYIMERNSMANNGKNFNPEYSNENKPGL